MSTSKSLYVIVVIAIVAAGVTGWQLYPLLQPQEPTDQEPPVPSVNLPQMDLTLVALNGTEIALDNSTIAELSSCEYKGGFMTSAGSIRGVGNYTGVPVTVLCDLAGGLNNDTSLRVTASDDYSMLFTYDQITGNFVTFDPSTGDEVQHNQSLIMILAYFFNGDPLPQGDGPLRLAIVGSEGLITEGHNWVKMIVKIEIRPAIRDWTLTLEGALSEEMDRATFESGANCHSANWTDSEDQEYTGIPLWLLLGRVDDMNVHETNETYKAFNRTLADEGYIVRIIAADGYELELNGTRVKLNNDIIVASKLNGMSLPEKYWPLKLVGANLTKSEMIRNIAKIKIVFGANWNLTLNGTSIETMNRRTFEEGADCHNAMWTDTDGQNWTGIPLWLLIGRVDDSVAHGSGAFNRTLSEEGYVIRLIATDGFIMEFNSTFVGLNDNIILTNEMNGMPLPEKYWPLRLVGTALTKSQMIRNVVEIQIIFELNDT